MKMHPLSRHGVLLLVACTLAACGGNGGGINPDVAGVIGSSTSTPRFGDDVVITLNGRNLDKPITVSAFSGSTCAGVLRSSAEPYVSTDTTAYYICKTPSVTAAAQHVQFLRPSDGVLLADVAFSVPEPQVAVSVSNGAGVSGTFTLTLEAGKVPATAYNFLRYAKDGFYTDTVFHRAVPGAFIQGGGYAKELVPGSTPLPTLKATGSAIPLEDNAGLSNLKWTVAMARQTAPNTATSQFFINLADNTFLDRNGSQRGYAVFGSVTAGTELVAAMAAAPCSAWPAFFGSGDASACLPAPNLVITSIVQTR
jgi:cyclophilin family peptidyl-prolyl cis-trans isomerase